MHPSLPPDPTLGAEGYAYDRQLLYYFPPLLPYSLQWSLPAAAWYTPEGTQARLDTATPQLRRRQGAVGGAKKQNHPQFSKGSSADERMQGEARKGGIKPAAHRKIVEDSAPGKALQPLAAKKVNPRPSARSTQGDRKAMGCATSQSLADTGATPKATNS